MQSPTTQPHHGAIHAPKHETFDIESKTNIDPKGFTRTDDTYVETSFGLYMGMRSRPSTVRIYRSMVIA